MSILNMELPMEVNKLTTFPEAANKVDTICGSLGGQFASRQVLAVFIILLERIEQLEKRLEENGIYQ